MNKIITYALFFCLSCSSLISCDKEDDNLTSKKQTTNTSEKQSTNTSKISRPEVSVESRKASGSYDGWWVIAKVTTGDDDPNNVECYLEWSKFPSKQSGTIQFTNKDKMRVQTSSKQRVLFKTEHAGINRGTYIYYRVTGKNSKYSKTSSTEYMIATN